MNYFKIVLFITLGLTFISNNSCSLKTNKKMAVFLRIKNNTEHNFSDLELRDTVLGVLEKGKYSKYNEYSKAYPYGRVYFKVDEAVFEMNPIDYLGVEKLKPGHYTYSISISSFEERQFSIELIKD